ncbi:exosome complex exonuclease RRP44-like [Astyanax mexicanus]|uniref:Exosome complex exonuclease RRP44-like n=1 Tax=Astyanax mexicanus TaxID=7994 RepID=A0A8T2KRG8_ASTMX|nr:exosome complex exonuclease RRP44-like [Astyanax mexicanus]
MDKHNYRHKMAQYAQRASVAFHTQGPTLAVEDQHTFHIFDKVKVTISLDASNIQHQKIRMALVEPVIPGVSVALPEPGPEAKKPKLDR